MSAFTGNIDAATETTDSLVFKPLAAVIYVYICSYLIWAATTAGQWLNTPGNRRGKRVDVKTSQSKPKKSTSTTVRMKNNNIKNTSTAQLQICNGSGPKSDTIIYNIKRSANQKMENRSQEKNFIIVVSKRERRRLQQLKTQKEEKQQEQKKQEEQLQQQKQDKQQQKKQQKSQELEQIKTQNKQQQKPQELEKQQNQEERKKLEKQQQKPKNQQQLKKKQPQEKQQQPNKQRHDNPLQQKIITPTINDITATLTKSPKTSVLLNEQPACQLNDKKSEVNVTKELLCIKNESSIKSFLVDCDHELNAERNVQLDEMQSLENLTASQGTQGFHDVVVEATCIKNYCSTTYSVKDSEKLEHLEIENVTKDIHENEKRCKEHDTMIKDLREENNNIRAQYELSMKNNWSDSEFKIVLEGVRAEIEMKRLDAIKTLVDDHQVLLGELKTEHDAEVNGLHVYYQSIISNIQMNHDIAIGAIHMKHEKIINNLRNINYDQSQRYETAMQSMRQVKVQMSKEHQTEVRALREKYENTVKDHEIAMSYLIEEKELLRAEHEKVVQEMSEKNEDQHHTTIKTIINGHDDKDVDTRTTTIADDGAVNMLKTENSMLNHTIID
uniref:Uncharacterized protein n=1 Tax=Schizaphis graminum TaxID=13262 RepID=A0A2S2NWA3_SCHGA